MDDAPIRQVMDAYTATVRAKDVDAFIGLYAQDVRVFDLWSNWSYDGAAAWRGMMTGWFDSLGTAQVAVGWDGVQTLVGTMLQSSMPSSATQTCRRVARCSARC